MTAFDNPTRFGYGLDVMNETKAAVDLRAGDRVVSGVSGRVFRTVRRVRYSRRKDWNHCTVYFREGGSTTVRTDTAFNLVSQPVA